MPNEQIKPSPGSLEDLVRENLELTKEIFELTKKTRKYILFGQIFNVIKVILIIGPIIIAIIYLPPIIKEFFGTYSELLGGGTGKTFLQGGGFVNQLLETQK